MRLKNPDPDNWQKLMGNTLTKDTPLVSFAVLKA